MLVGSTASLSLYLHSRIRPSRRATVDGKQEIVQRSVGAHTNRPCFRYSAVIAAGTVAAAASTVDQPADNGLSMHPDAIKRRQEAEARHAVQIAESLTSPSLVRLMFLPVCRREARKEEIAYAKTNLWWEASGPDNLILATSEDMLKETVMKGEQAKQLVAVKFFAPWCQACKALYPKWMQLATQNPDVTFVKVNAADETMRAVAAAMGVTKLPYFHMYMHGQLAKNFTANLHKVSYLKRAISDCKHCLNPGCH